MEKQDLKIFTLSTPPPLSMFLGPIPSMGKTREQHSSHKGGTREKHNSYKWQNVETKCHPTITKWTLRSSDQTLKRHHVRTLTLSKRGRRWRAEYNTCLRGKAVVYNETWNAWEAMQPVPILYGSALKLYALSQEKKEERRKSHVSQFRDPRGSDINRAM